MWCSALYSALPFYLVHCCSVSLRDVTECPLCHLCVCVSAEIWRLSSRAVAPGGALHLYILELPIDLAVYLYSSTEK